LYTNQWVTYGRLKKSVPKNLSSKLHKAIAAGLIINDNQGGYAFLSENTLHLATLALEKVKYDELWEKM